MQMALDFAESRITDWGRMAYDHLLHYAMTHDEFMVEELRQHAHASGLPEPPSARAWGAVTSKAFKLGNIVRVGYRAVSNPKAHCTPAAVWKHITKGAVNESNA
jgi:hypothetical protein